MTYHCKKVVIALDLSRHLGKLLVKSIGDVVGRICGDDEDALPDRCQLDSQTTARQMNQRRDRYVHQENGSPFKVLNNIT